MMYSPTERQEPAWVTIGYCGRCWSEVDNADEHCDHCGNLRSDGWFDDPLRGITLSERYALKERIGEGGMALVYRARDERLQRDIALKILRPEYAGTVAARRFLAEARMASRLASPHVVEIYDFGDSDNVVYIASELLVGAPLEVVIEDGPHDAAFVAAMLEQVGAALEEAHAAGIVHRDVKPANIFVSQHASGPHFELLDFGIARAVEEAQTSTRLTRTGFIVGTAPYMSPEQVTGERDLDGRSDLYSLGLVATELLTGMPAHEGSTGREIMLERLTIDRPPLADLVDDPSTVPPRLFEIIDAMVEREVEDRLPSTKMMLDLLEDLDAPVAAHMLPAAPARKRLTTQELPDPREVSILHATGPMADAAIEDVVRAPRRRAWLAAVAALVLGATGAFLLDAQPPAPAADYSVSHSALTASDATTAATPAPEPTVIVRRGAWNDVRIVLAHVLPIEGDVHRLTVTAERQDRADGSWSTLTLDGATLRLRHHDRMEAAALASRALGGADEASFAVELDRAGRYHVDVALLPVTGESVRFRCDVCTADSGAGCEAQRDVCMPMMASEIAHADL